MVLLDHKYALHHLREDGELYEDPSKHFDIENASVVANAEISLWDGDRVEVIKERTIDKPEFQSDLEGAMSSTKCEVIESKNYDFKNKTKTWTDYLRTRFHPRSFQLLRSIREPNEEMPFDCYSAGVQLWKEEYLDDSFGDRIRQYIEECDNCQGFQMLFDCNDAFSGVGVKCLEYLTDEYGKSSLAIPIFSPQQTKFSSVNKAMADSVRVLNAALTYSELIDHSSLILPLSVMNSAWRQLERPRKFDYFNYDAHNLYESSAVLATYLDTVSLRYRLNEQIDSCHLAGFCSDLSNYGRKLVAAGLSMPFVMNADHELIDCLDQFDGQMFTQLSPNSKVGTDRIVQTISVRGIAESRLKNRTSPKEMERQMKMAAYKCDSVAEMMQLYFQCSNYASLAHVSAIEKPLNIKTPFPHDAFDLRMSKTGFVNHQAMETDRAIVESIPVMATAQCSNELHNTLESLQREAKRIKISKIPRFKESGLESDELIEALEKLGEFQTNYEDSFDL